MTNKNHPKVRDLLDNYDNYMEQLIAMTDKVLEKKVRLARMQMQMALEQQKYIEVDVLYLFCNMIIEARVKKQEMGIDDEEEPKEESDKTAKQKKAKKKQEIKAELPENTDLTEADTETEIVKPEQLLLF